MKFLAGLYTVLFCLHVLPAPPVLAWETEKVIVVLIDGLRYSDGLGSPDSLCVPRMKALSKQGTKIEPFLNDGITKTSRAVPAIWCGAWTPIEEFSDSSCGGVFNNHSVLPTVFEYYRKGLDRPLDDCVYVIKELCSWKGSLDPDYGPEFWPTYHTVGSSDTDVWQEARRILETQSPGFMLLYLADVDLRGHDGDWEEYVRAVATADEIVGELWELVQWLPDYSGKTTLFVTNDHGRHTHDFQNHGDDCEGCRTIQLLAVGPDIKRGWVSNTTRSIPDLTPTVGALLGFPAPMASGSVMTSTSGQGWTSVWGQTSASISISAGRAGGRSTAGSNTLPMSPAVIAIPGSPSNR